MNDSLLQELKKIEEDYKQYGNIDGLKIALIIGGIDDFNDLKDMGFLDFCRTVYEREVEKNKIFSQIFRNMYFEGINERN